ncbi:sugar MFS transporter [Parabacteroides sp. Marseille-P3160]|uniref:MFS transporter n=1 Tax=Parabacteroides sp. Marseille-P3160 TaxID=1917887 RepID=UPI0009BA2F51|nr:MFS transporter [Parabacteroides sp. Marseille-P3160]
MKTNNLKMIIPSMLCFFVMGIVDLVGVSTNFLRNDFQLNDFTATILPMMVFLWFAVFSIPTCILMGHIGRKKTVLLSIIITLTALALPFISYNFYIVVVSFALLGIGNTILQVSLNPLVASIVKGDKLASTLTFGQFIKAIASFLGPILASMAAKQFADWMLVFIVYAIVSALSFVWLYFTDIGNSNTEKIAEPTTYIKTLSILKDNVILQLFLGIVLIVGIDVCMNTNTPQLLIQKLGLETETASLGSSLYFGTRTLGAFVGAMILVRMKPSNFLCLNMLVAIVAFLMLMFANNGWMLYVGVAFVGFTCANVFSIIFSMALQYKPNENNEISSLMIMGIAGGAIVTPVVGLAAKEFGIAISFGILLLSVIYILFLSVKFPKKHQDVSK